MSKLPTAAAAIDLGSNSFRLMVGAQGNQGLLTLSRLRHTIRLAQGLGRDGHLAKSKIEGALEIITAFRREMDHFAINRIRCCGTEALRRAANSRSLIEPAEIILGAKVEILSGVEEAELSSLGVKGALTDQLVFPCLIVDVGGGSSELIFYKSVDRPAAIVSLPIGAVRLAEQAATARALTLRLFAEQIKSNFPAADRARIITLVATGGTASSLAALAQQLPLYDPARITGYVLSRDRVAELAGLLSQLPTEHRKALPGLEAGREDIIQAGLEIYQEILATIGATGMIVSDAGLLEGILLSITGS